jgi:hypothetical protein
MKISDGPVDPAGGLIGARARLARAEASVTTAKQEAKAAKRRRKEAKAAAWRAKKRLRRAKKERAEARSALVTAEKSQEPPAPARQLKPVQPGKVEASTSAPKRVVPPTKKPRKRAVPAPKRNRSRSVTATPAFEVPSEAITGAPVDGSPPITPPDLPPQTEGS